MIDKKAKAVHKAKEYLNQLKGSSHDQRHVESVLGFAKEIAKEIPEADIDVLEISCWWHDVGRVCVDHGHEEKSAKMAEKELREMGFLEEFIKKVHDAIIGHAVNTNPKTLEGKILKDADKLDYLPIWRWEVMIKDNEEKNMKAMIEDIEKMRNHQLHFQISKQIFDKLYEDFKKFIDENAIEAKPNGSN